MLVLVLTYLLTSGIGHTLFLLSYFLRYKTHTSNPAIPEQVGGRILTEELPFNGKSEPFDMGAAYVSRSQTHIMELLDDLGIETYRQYCTVCLLISFYVPPDSLKTQNVLAWDGGVRVVPIQIP